eukprot:2506774-Prymnesium_polylepis.1
MHTSNSAAHSALHSAGDAWADIDAVFTQPAAQREAISAWAELIASRQTVSHVCTAEAPASAAWLPVPAAMSDPALLFTGPPTGPPAWLAIEQALVQPDAHS